MKTALLPRAVKSMAPHDARATRAFQTARGRKWLISPTVIIEILLTNNSEHKENIIYFSQSLFDRELLPTPEEILLNFIRNGCPLQERSFSYTSNHWISILWRDLYDFPDKTFIYDRDEFIKRYNSIKEYYKFAHLIAKPSNIVKYNNIETALDILAFDIVKRIFTSNEINFASTKQISLWKITSFLCFSLLCSEITLFPETIRTFWKSIGIVDIFERLNYLVRFYPVLFYRGPFAEMAMMILSQSHNKYSRGLIFDSYHCVYLPFIDNLVTADAHFSQLKNYFPHPITFRITHFNDVSWTNTPIELIKHECPKLYLNT